MLSVVEPLARGRPPLARSGAPVLTVAAADPEADAALGGADAIDACVRAALDGVSGVASLWGSDLPESAEGDEIEAAAAAADDDADDAVLSSDPSVDAIREYWREQRRSGQGAAVRTVLGRSEATAALAASGGGRCAPWSPAWEGDEAAAWVDAPAETGEEDAWERATEALLDAATAPRPPGGWVPGGAAQGPAEESGDDAGVPGADAALAAAAVVSLLFTSGPERAAELAVAAWSPAEPRSDSGDDDVAALLVAGSTALYGQTCPPALRHVLHDAGAALLQSLEDSATGSDDRSAATASLCGLPGASALLAGSAEPYGVSLRRARAGASAWFAAAARSVQLHPEAFVAAAAAAVEAVEEPPASEEPGRTGPMGVYVPRGFPLHRPQPQASRLDASAASSLRQGAWVELEAAGRPGPAAMDAASLLAEALGTALVRAAAEGGPRVKAALRDEATASLHAMAAMARWEWPDGQLLAAAGAGPPSRAARRDIAARLLSLGAAA